MEHARTSSTAWAAWTWSGLAAAYFLAATLSHELISRVYLCLAEWLGMAAAFRMQDALALLGLGAGAWLVLGPGRRSGRIGGREALAWLAVAILLVAADRLLVITPVERVHYPQYAILALLLRRVLGDEALVLGLACAAGMADELRQYLAHPGNTRYLDWNDFCLNLLGAAAGLLLARALGLRPLAGPRAAGRARMAFLAGCGALAGGLAAAWLQGRIIPYAPVGGTLDIFPRLAGKASMVLSFFRPEGFWTLAESGRSHHVLAPGEGLAVLATLFSSLAWLLAWSRKNKRPGSPQAPRPEVDRITG